MTQNFGYDFVRLLVDNKKKSGGVDDDGDAEEGLADIEADHVS